MRPSRNPGQLGGIHLMERALQILAEMLVQRSAEEEYSVAGETKFHEEMAMSDNESSVGGFGWFLAGLGIGALVGVLYAPKAGKETRDDIVAGALDARDRANQMYAQGVDQVGQYVEQGKQAANEYVGKGKQVASDYVDKGKEYYDKGRSQWSEYVEKGKDLIQNQADAAKAAVEAGKDAYAAKTSEATPVV